MFRNTHNYSWDITSLDTSLQPRVSRIQSTTTKASLDIQQDLAGLEAGAQAQALPISP